MAFAERLKELRKQAHLTQVELAKRLGIGQSSYADWERGRKKPTQENLVKISQVLSVSIDYLVGNSEENSNDLDNIELLFRMNSKGFTDEEKEIFKKELIDFMEKRKKVFDNEDWQTYNIEEARERWELPKEKIAKEFRVSIRRTIWLETVMIHMSLNIDIDITNSN